MAKAGNVTDKENGMDYAEHDRTYANFLWLTKWTIASVAAVLIAMLAGFFGGMGLVGGLLVFIVLMIVAYFVV